MVGVVARSYGRPPNEETGADMSEIDTRHDLEYKVGVRREWTVAAPGWERWFDTTEAAGAGRVITAVLLDRAALLAGDHVLDVGAGYGEPGLSAAVAVGPTGTVTCLDISGDMLAFAERRASGAGLSNVAFVEADIEDHPLDSGSFDVVLSRAALMYASDPLSTLRRLYAALRPGGRLAAAVWASPDKVAFATPVGVMVEMGVIAPPPPGPGPFALGADGLLETIVRDSGFIDVASGTAVAVYEAPSPEACTQWLRDVAPPIADLIADQPSKVQQDVWERVTEAWTAFQGDDGAVRLPCTAVWVSGRANA
jgi:ubiquinone/menaquinone biosynthesis C-methylase UbiE